MTDFPHLAELLESVDSPAVRARVAAYLETSAVSSFSGYGGEEDPRGLRWMELGI